MQKLLILLTSEDITFKSRKKHFNWFLLKNIPNLMFYTNIQLKIDSVFFNLNQQLSSKICKNLLTQLSACRC